MSPAENVSAFWKETETSLGEKVQVYTMGRCLEGCSDAGSQVPMWGLFFLTERALYFRHFPKESRILSIPSPSLSSGDEEIYFSIPLNRITNVTVNREQSWLKRFFSPSPPEIIVECNDESIPTRQLRFSLEFNTDAFLAILQS